MTMHTKLSLTLTCTILLFTACKKTSGDNPATTTNSITSTLQAGKGTWQLPADVITYYDKNNVKLFTSTYANIGYWTFTAADQGKIQFGSPTVINSTVVVVNSYDFPYTLTIENGQGYLTTNDYPNPLIKYQISSITNTSVSLTMTDVSLSFYNELFVLTTADHALEVLTLIKYQ